MCTTTWVGRSKARTPPLLREKMLWKKERKWLLSCAWLHSIIHGLMHASMKRNMCFSSPRLTTHRSLFFPSIHESIAPWIKMKSSMNGWMTDWLQDDFNWNYGISLAQTGSFKQAEEALLLVQSEKYKAEYCYISWLARCYISNGQPRNVRQTKEQNRTETNTHAEEREWGRTKGERERGKRRRSKTRRMLSVYMSFYFSNFFLFSWNERNSRLLQML